MMPRDAPFRYTCFIIVTGNTLSPSYPGERGVGGGGRGTASSKGGHNILTGQTIYPIGLGVRWTPGPIG